MQYEWRHGQYELLEKLFTEALRPYGSVRMWRLYLQYVHLCNPPSKTGAEKELHCRQTINKAYELALSTVGLDLRSSSLYIDYIAFISSWSVSSIFVANASLLIMSIDGHSV